VAALRAWYDAEGATAETVSAGAGLATAQGAGGGNAAQRTSLVGMQPEVWPCPGIFRRTPRGLH